MWPSFLSLCSAWKYSVFLIQDEKGSIFIAGYVGLEERPHWKEKILNKLKHPPQTYMLCFISDEKNFLLRSDVEQLLVCSAPQDVLILMKTKQPVSIIVFGVVTSNGDVMLPFIFPHDLKFNMEPCIKCLGKVVLRLPI